LILPESQAQREFPFDEASSPETLFARVFRRLRLASSEPAFNVEYRPFAGLRSSVVLRDHRAEVRMSDVLSEAPPVVIEALAEILLAQAFRRRPSREARECYLAYVYTPSMRRRVDAARRQRARGRLLPAKGRVYDLATIFARLNRRYFKKRLPPARIGWSLRPLRSVFGHYDPSRKTITISRGLDAPSVPGRMVEFMVFHEMLHMQFPVERNGGRRVIHTKQFRAAERKFPGFDSIHRRLRYLPD
jgi:SprT-like family